MGINYILVASWTMEEEGSKRVEVAGKDDKLQLTALLVCSISGFFPMQLVYQGKTFRSLPKYQFPSDWDIVFTLNHWAMSLQCSNIFDKIILPSLSKKKELKFHLNNLLWFSIISKANVLRNFWYFWIQTTLMWFLFRRIALIGFSH